MAIDKARIEEIRSRYEDLALVMDERVTRLWAAGEAKALGRGGIAAVTEATGILGKRIRYGIRDLAELQASPPSPLLSATYSPIVRLNVGEHRRHPHGARARRRAPNALPHRLRPPRG